MVTNKRKIGVFDIINYLLMACIAIATLYPFFHVVMTSFSPIEEIMRSDFFIIPRKMTLEAYTYVLKYGNLGDAYQVSLFVTIVGTLVNLLLTSMGAYAISIRDLPGRKLLTMMIVFTMLFNGGLIPTYLVVKNLGLINTRWALILPTAINSFWLILMRNFFQTIPYSLSEAARIDGCSEIRIMVQIILPLSAPILATLTLFYGIMHWNEYYQAMLYVSKPSLRPLQMVIRQMYEQALDRNDGDILPPPTQTVRAATIVLATFPVLCIYPFLQKYFAQGIMVGAVKA